MKKFLILLLLFSLYKTSFAQKGQQTFGLLVGSEFTTPGQSDLFMEREPIFSYTGGVYYDLNFSRRFGFNIAPSQRVSEQKIYDFCVFCSDFFTEYSVHRIELPVNFTLNLDSKETAKWKSYFSIGYTYSYLFLVRDKTSGDFMNLNEQFWIDRNDHYVQAGLEVRHNFSENYTLAINPVTRFQIDQEVGNLAFGLNFKVGRIL